MKDQSDGSERIAELHKAGEDVVRVELSKYRGHDMIGVRVWWPFGNGKDQPLRNGIDLNVKHLPKLTRAVRRARKKAIEAGLL